MANIFTLYENDCIEFGTLMGQCLIDDHKIPNMSAFKYILVRRVTGEKLKIMQVRENVPGTQEEFRWWVIL